MLTSDSWFNANACASGSLAFWWPESVPHVAKPRATGTGVSRLASRNGARPVISVPLVPPPPYWTALPFHLVGRFTSKFTGGALRSTGRIAPSTLQNSLAAPCAVGSAGTVWGFGDLIVAPFVGRAVCL